MFQVSDSKFLKWPVRVSVPTDGGKTEDMEFTAHLAQLNGEDLVQTRRLPDVEFCQKVLLGWDGVEDAGKPLKYSEAARNKLAGIPYVAKAVAVAFYGMTSGEAVEQNLKKS